jgi:AcrR family transcriptional regulator
MSSAGPRRTQEQRRAATRAAILATARDLFAEHGYHGCSVDAILAQAGSSKGAFYHHFADKAAVLEALLEEFERDAVDRASAATAGLTSTIEIISVSLADFLELCTDPAVRQAVLIDALSVLGFERWHRIDDRYTLDVLDQLLQRGIAQGEIRPIPSPRTMARLIIGATNEAALFVANADDPVGARREAIASFDILLASLATGPGGA